MIDELHEAPRFGDTTADKAEAWRLEQLLDAGYPLAAASAIAARHDIDLHQALELRARGCQPDLAARILL